MRILHAYNLHRGRGGADDACIQTIRISRERGVDLAEFVRDSRDLGDGFAGKASAFINGIYSRDGVEAFSTMLHDFRPDIVHAHELYPLISPWILPRCTEAGIPVVMTCYDFRLTCPIATHYRRGALCTKCMGGNHHWAAIHNCRGSIAESIGFSLRSLVADKASLFRDHVSVYIAPSDFSARWLTDNAGIDPRRIITNYCTLPLPSTPVPDPSAGTYVAFAGRFAQEKGSEILIDAARRARVPIRLAGNAPDHPAIRPGDDARCILTRSKDELAAFYRGARLLVSPSIWNETFGLVPAESMSHGVPVIVSRMGALEELVEDGVSGLHFDPGNASELAEKITRIWTDPVLCRTMGARAREWIRLRCSEDAHHERLMGAYQLALA